jgi:hypothetical protein
MRAGKMCREVKIGNEVAICCGPLSGVHGIVISGADNGRILVEVSLSRRPIVLELDAEFVRRISGVAGPNV